MAKGVGHHRKRHWKQDPDGVRADILRVATEEYSRQGLAGARISEIVRRTRTSKRMIYYYFGGKEELYLSVLEAAYARVRSGETALRLEEHDPVTALRKLVEFTFDYHRENPDFVRLILIENIHEAAYIGKSERISSLNRSAIDQLTDICRRGVDAGLFRPDASPLQLHWLITSASVFNVSNRATFAHIFGPELQTAAGQAGLREMVVAVVMGAALKTEGGDRPQQALPAWRM